MVRISKAISATKLQDYHKREFTSPAQSYWSQGQQVQGHWQGQLAGKFGLSGTVGADEFTRLSEGQHPLTGEQLVLHRQPFEYANADGEMVKSVQHRAGWDATFSPPKSVSLTALVGGDDRIRVAHGEAVTIALTELERYTQARIGGNRPAETTGQFIAAKFEHDLSRPVDGYAAPQLHTHAVIFNVTERENGQTRALQEHGYFDTQQFATAVYQSELTFRLRQLGYEIEPGRSGAPEIRGYSLHFLDANSERSEQIREHLRTHGVSGPKAEEIAAHATRGEKLTQTPEEIMAAHRSLAAQFGNQPDKVVADALERSRGKIAERQPETMQRVAREAVTFARDRSFEREAVTDERDLFRDALRRGMSETTYTEVRASFEARVAAGEFRLVSGQKHDSGRSFTTPETIRAEEQVIRRMQQGQGRAEPMMSIQNAVRLTGSRELLNDAQRRAIEQILTSRDIVQGLQGRAGGGKSTLLKSVREGAEQHGFVVAGFAPTSRAAQQLRDVGVSADTLQGFLARSVQPDNRRHLYMVDESSLASTRQMRDFLQKIGTEDRVLLIGDTRQHQGVDAGKPFEQLVHAGMQTAALDQIIRQKDPELLKAVEHLSRGEVAQGVALLEQQGRVTEIADPQKRVAAIARSYAASPDNTIVVSPDNASRRQINEAVRSELQAHGIVQPDDHMFRVLSPRSDMTGADRTWAARYDVGDVLHYQRGSKDIGIERQSYAQVVATQPQENLLTVQKSDGEHVTYNPARLHGISAYREIERAFAVGDRLSFTAPSKELGVANRDLGTVQQIDKDGHFSVRMDNGKSVSFDANQMRHYDHGYAVTSHSSQGLTAERVMVNVDSHAHADLINKRFAYVAVSRGSHDAHIYTDNATFLVNKLAHDVVKSSALQVGQQFSAEQNAGFQM
jgi:conjugative relaxase-like TrwC/TraI family protein